MSDRGDDYLWEGTGTPDPDVRRLEGLLGRYRYEPSAARRGGTPIGRWIGLAAAALALAIGGYLWLRSGDASPGPGETSEPVCAVEGIVGDVEIDSAWAAESRLGVGDRIRTGSGGQARLVLPAIGEVQVKERSQLQVVQMGRDRSELALERGRIRARITSEPRVFNVGTRAALAVDLGCIYELAVDENDETHLEVFSGAVSLEMDERTVYVPADGVCRAVPGRGPGIPYWSHASKELVAAVRALEDAVGDPEAAAKALTTCLAAAADHDTLTLWHLFEVADRAGRGLVFDKLDGSVPAPEGVTRARCVALDREALERYRSRLDDAW